MSETKPERQTTALDFDLKQWRRDIQTFADATRQAIESIVSDLAGQCSGMRPQSRSTSSVRSNEGDSHGRAEKSGDDRLSDLKAKLAARLGNSK